MDAQNADALLMVDSDQGYFFPAFLASSIGPLAKLPLPPRSAPLSEGVVRPKSSRNDGPNYQRKYSGTECRLRSNVAQVPLGSVKAKINRCGNYFLAGLAEGVMENSGQYCEELLTVTPAE
jgi:hypothetical protein